jgi:hypothetical protein
VGVHVWDIEMDVVRVLDELDTLIPEVEDHAVADGPEPEGGGDRIAKTVPRERQVERVGLVERR